MRIKERLASAEKSKLWRSQMEAFYEHLDGAEAPTGGRALSVSCGKGMWDYCVLHRTGINEIHATDIVDCAVHHEDRERLNQEGRWKFQRIAQDRPLPFDDESFDLVFHQDVIEHVMRPRLFLAEQHRVLRRGGTLVFGTPNLLRPANILKLITGKLVFPSLIGEDELIGEYTHLQEFCTFHLNIMLEETGFCHIKFTHSFFGISFINMKFCDFPKSNIGKSMCQYITVSCKKIGDQVC